LSVVIPLYNEEENVQPLYDELKGVLEKLGKTYEVLLVDDGSTDKTFKKLETIAAADPNVVVLRFRRNFGQTAALSAGIERARGEVIVPMDGDLQNDPADIPKLLEKMEADGFECVSGWRKNRQDSGTRVLPSKIANWLISWLSGVHIHDYGCTMKAYKREVIEEVRLYGEMHRFVPIYAHWQGARVTEMVTNHRARQFGKSKYGFNRILKVVLDLMVVKFLFQYLSKPIYIFGGFGLMALGASFVSAGLAVYLKLAGIKDFVTTPLPLFAGISALVGVQSILVGLLAEVLVRTYYESQGKRPYIIGQVLESRGGPMKPTPISDRVGT
ncbi:MAG: glycosyltransferase family 2 protein, partial [Myxococcaceae bacterium]|nr:glycosyltransferase family 2 protein [Myxococcaceae bacterium]